MAADFSPARAAAMNSAHAAGLAKRSGPLDAARDNGYKGLWGMIAHDNRPMLGLVHRMGFGLNTDPNDPTIASAELFVLGADPGRL